ncbi:hypothetical protein TRVA0_007S01772 [Trichomonascus vanleenenianus]|uniref:DUF2264 domain-containing protein n=1 Tax=Trichomonascus vanleenenianus TaxID=2268995 RepID=UPI003ECACDB9
MTLQEVGIEHFNPMGGAKLESRADVASAFEKLFEPMLKGFSDSGAEVLYDLSAAHFDRKAISLEGYARPLWGIVPYVLGGHKFAHWDLYRKGLANGCDPEHPHYWGPITATTQQQVEMAALGFALAFLPEHMWEPLSETAKKNVAQFLVTGRDLEFHTNNWMFFRVLVDMALETVGVPFDRKLTTDYLEKLSNLYVADGYYRDGMLDTMSERSIDHYNGFALHFYALIYAQRYPKSELSPKFKERARLFAPRFREWFDDNGSVLPYGRSLTYRFACASFWGAVAFSGEPMLPWGEVKGLYMRHLRWWSQQPVSRRDDGVLSVGYAYPNTFMSESYNSSDSPYWSMKAFLPLALPESHPFWQAQETALDRAGQTIADPVPGFIFNHVHGTNTVVLTGGSINPFMRHSAEKYCKLAYSTRYGFSVESDYRHFDQGVFSNMLSLSDDDDHYRVREGYKECRINGSTLVTTWKPWSDVTVKTYLYPEGQWYVAVHVIDSARELSTIEGGFAIPGSLPQDWADSKIAKDNSSVVIETADDYSAIVALSLSSVSRAVRIQRTDGNTNIMNSKTVLPQIRARVPANKTTVLAAAFLANVKVEETKKALASPPKAPTLEQLKDIEAKSDVVGIYK